MSTVPRIAFRAGLAETRHDDKGLLWPISIAPYEVLIIPLKTDDEELMSAANSIYAELKEQGVDVLMDDRSARPGVKFNDADLIGIPYRIVIGGKGLKEGVAEVKARTDADAEKVPLDQVVANVTSLVSAAKEALNA